jgi:spermidine/putrescine ABC transporter ATP-binding subunit
MAEVTLTALTKRYGTTKVVDHLSIRIARGEFLTLLGPSGCGKTTTLRLIAGLAAPDGGRITLAGDDVTDLPTHRRNIGMVFQSHALFPHMSVAENVAFGLRMRGVDRASRDKKAQAALDRVHLSAFRARLPSQLSGGQQQRVALARALVFDPHVLLLDEPFGALDRKLRELMQHELRDLTRRIGITAIFVTHDQEEALMLSDRVAVMNAGRIEQVDTPAAIFERPTTPFVADFMGFGNIMEGHASGGLIQAGGLRLRTTAAEVTDGPVQVGLRAERISLAAANIASNGDNVSMGIVTEATYHGTLTTYRIAPHSGGPALLVREASPGGTRFAPGAHVVASWAPDAVRVLTQ